MPPPSWTGTRAAARMAATAVGVDRSAGEGAVQVDDVEPLEAGVLPGASLGGRVGGVDRGLVHGAALQADAGAVLQVDGGVEGEAGHGSM